VLLLADGSAPVNITVSTSVVNGMTVAVLTFSESLPDGSYTFTIHGSGVQDNRGHTLAHDLAADFTVSAGVPNLIDLMPTLRQP
jgi:hypothetical protein